MWHLKYIPKIMRFYWGGEKLSFLRYMTFKSFTELNSGWRSILYVPKVLFTGKNPWNTHEQSQRYNGFDYMREIDSLRIEIKEIDMSDIGVDNDIPEVHKSDFFRLHILGEEGGFWSDSDIVYFKPIDNLSINQKINQDRKSIFCIHGKPCPFHSIGLIGSSINNPCFKYLFDLAKEVYKPFMYESVGSVMMSRVFPNTEHIKKRFPRANPINLPMHDVYLYDSGNIPTLYKEEPKMKEIKEKSIGCHWYGGHPMSTKFENEINEFNFKDKNNIVGRLVSRVNILRGDKMSYLEIFCNVLRNNLGKDETVLDIGCGDKKIESYFHENHFVSVDAWGRVNPDYLIDLEKEDLPFLENSFDVVFMLDFIEHLSRERGEIVLEQAMKICKKRIVLFTPLVWSDNEGNTRDPNMWCFGNLYNYHKSLWTLDDFKEWKRFDYKPELFLGVWRKNG